MFFVYNAVFYYFSKLFFLHHFKAKTKETEHVLNYRNILSGFRDRKRNVKYCEIGSFSSDICIKNTENSKKKLFKDAFKYHKNFDIF